MIKLTAKEVRELYKVAWTGDSTNAEIAEKYNVTKNVVSSIKNGFTWGSVTLHIRGTVPSVAQTPFKEKMKTIFKTPDADITIDNRFWDLSEEFGSDIAYLFKQKIYDMRGTLRRKLTITEVEEIYDQFRKQKTEDKL